MDTIGLYKNDLSYLKDEKMEADINAIRSRADLHGGNTGMYGEIKYYSEEELKQAVRELNFFVGELCKEVVCLKNIINTMS